MKKSCLFFVLTVFLGCSGSAVNIPPDFSVVYNSQNVLMNWQINIAVNSESMKIDYKNPQEGKSGNGQYTITESEAKRIYNYMKSSGFLTMAQPEGEQIVDMPTQNIKGTYGGKTNYIEFGTVRILPEALTKLKQMIFDLATKYHSNWKKDMNFE